MSEIKFVESIPAPSAGASTVKPLIAQLAQRPGNWAEIVSLPRGDHARAASRGGYMKSLDSRVQTAVRTVDGRVVLFARVVNQ